MQWMPSFVDMQTYLTNQRKWIGNLLENISRDTDKKFQIFDVGAHEGLITDSMLSVVENKNCLITLFEPHPQSFEFLCEKYKHKQQVKIYPYVVGNQKKQSVQFNCSNTQKAQSYLYHSPIPEKTKLTEDWKTVDRRSILLDDFVDQNYTTMFIKIDAEGHDFYVLQGASSILQQHRPFVLFEFSGKLNSDSYRYQPGQWFNFFQKHHYELVAPMGQRDQKFILSHFHCYHPDLIDLLAIPIEKKTMVQIS